MTTDQQKLEFQAAMSALMPKLAYDNDNEKRLALSGFESKFFDTYKIQPDAYGFHVVERSTGDIIRDEAQDIMTPGDVVQEFALSKLKLSKDISKGINNGLPAINSIEDLDVYLEEKHGDSVGGKDWCDERGKLREELGV